MCHLRYDPDDQTYTAKVLEEAWAGYLRSDTDCFWPFISNTDVESRRMKVDYEPSRLLEEHVYPLLTAVAA